MHSPGKLRVLLGGLTAALVALAGLTLAATPARADLIGFTTDARTGDLFRVDFGAGTTTLVGSTGVGGGNPFGDLATSNDGSTLYGISQFGGGIYTINPLTGAATLVNGNVDQSEFYSGFDLDSQGRALVTNFDTLTDVSRINLTSPAGLASVQDDLEVGFVDAMVVESDNSIIVLTRGVSTDPDSSVEYLRRINLTTRGVTTIGSTRQINNILTGIEGNISGIDFFDGTLYGINLVGDLFRFNLATGEATQIGTQTAGANRLFLGLTTNVTTGAIPEPASVAMISIGLACVGASRVNARRRARLGR